MSPDTVDMDTRRRLADRVDPQLPKNERETGIDWFQTDDRATITSYSPGIVRDLLRHREARVCWIYATGSAEPTGRVRNPSELLNADVAVEGVQVTVPVGTLGVKGVVRTSSRDSGVVNTPDEADEAREAFADGGQYRLPGVGDPVLDREGGDRLVVVDVHPGTAAAEYAITSGATVADHNDEYDPAAPVVDAVYTDEVGVALVEWRSVADLRRAADDGKLTVYSFPTDRLAPVGEVGA